MLTTISHNSLYQKSKFFLFQPILLDVASQCYASTHPQLAETATPSHRSYPDKGQKIAAQSVCSLYVKAISRSLPKNFRSVIANSLRSVHLIMFVVVIGINLESPNTTNVLRQRNADKKLKYLV
ncbi:hypothetical protein TNCV_4782701 [Trichonephila clavipes]|nr:hypothetical protein TNCV_4782701 [Trichonephila clavipes]